MMHVRQSDELTILVEGRSDKAIVEHLVNAIGEDARARTVIKACDGKGSVRRLYHKYMRDHQNVVALVDADEPSVPDAEAWARDFFETTNTNVFCVVPTIEAWVFADKDLALKHALQSDHARSTISRLVTPESLSNVKYLINQVFDRAVIKSNFPFLKEINIGRAVASSSSMYRFLRGVEMTLGREWPFVEQQLSDSLNRKVFANLLREVPGKTIGWKTLTGEYTAEQLGDLILKGDEVGLRYVTDLLRLARDILAARAQPNEEHDIDA